MHPSEVHWTKDAPAGRFTQSEHEFLETVVLNLKHRLLLYSCILYCCAHVHTRTHSPILRLTQVHSCLSVHTHILYLGEYLLPTTLTQVPLVSIKDTEIRLLTGLNTCIQTNSVHENCLHMHKRMNLGTRGTLREAWSACVPRCCGVSQGQLSVHAYVEVGVGEGGSLGLAQVRAFPHPLYSILSITTGEELIAMAALNPWPPIGSLVAMGYGALSRPPLRGLCVKGVLDF